MRDTRPLPSREELLATFDYDPETGVLRWKAPRRKIRVGDVAGSLQKSGRIAVGSREKKIYAHRIIWKMMTGEEPPEIDHKDTDPANNRWANLRTADRFTNNQNRRKSAGTSSRFKGVRWHTQRKCWEARITAYRKERHLGTFDSEEDAGEAYRVASQLYHGAFGNACVFTNPSIAA